MGAITPRGARAASLGVAEQADLDVDVEAEAEAEAEAAVIAAPSSFANTLDRNILRC